ncbi:hypothetical protein T265_04117 [Opisthorchis viverrini]|uniref:Beta-amyloid-like protein n=1 Tax=Opisthorchis viverrini TaxID=6198 RepID=A0A075AGY1_OPIVI|nr:hypothetical protein T265_04117 [Opisthorchis viverrini]KER29179.1 hypothetical protein T265_04117 [Opisthorchis viverrini]
MLRGKLRTTHDTIRPQKRRDTSLSVKDRVYIAAVRSILLHGSETQPLRSEDTQRISVFDHRRLQSIARVWWEHRISNAEFFACSFKEVPKAVAFYCGRPALYLTANGWELDQFTDCLNTKSDIVNFCRRVYPDANITNASFSPVVDILLRGWCHQQNSSCSLEESSVYRIQPWICSAQKPPLNVPRGCQLKEFGGSSNATCRKSEYWKHLVSEHCMRLRQVEYIKPCIKPDSYLHTHYLGVLAVCCAIKKGKGVVTTSPPSPAIQPSKSNFSFPLPISSKSDDSLIIDQNVAIYQGYLNQLTATTTMGTIAEPDKSREKQRYSIAKKAGHEAYHRRKHILEQELAEAEAQFSDMDWIRNPEQTQNAENRLHKEFRQKYLALDQEARAIDHDLLLTHQQRVSHSVGKRFEAAALAWDNAVRNAPSNLTQLLSAIEHLQRVVERDRYHLIRRWEHLQATDPLEASRVLSNLRGRLDDVERQFNRSLEKLDQVPLLKDAILHHVAQLRDREYPQLDAMVKSLHHVSMPEADGVLLPTADQEAALEAETIIAKYRHHLPKLDLDNKSGKTNTKPEGNKFASKITRIGEAFSSCSSLQVPLLKDAILHHVAQLRDREYPQLDAMVKSLHHVSMPEADGVLLPTADQEAALEAETIIAKYRHHLPKLDLDNKSGKTNTKPEGNKFASKITRIGEDDSTNGDQSKPPTPRWDLHVSAYDATPSAFGPQHAKQDTLLINDTRSSQPAANTQTKHTHPSQPQGLGTVTKWFLALTAVFGILIATLFVLRYRIRRARLHRAGYSCTVAEVDEITAVDVTGVDQTVGLHDDEADRLVNWRFNGYENPAYKYPDNVVRFPRA